MKISRIPEATSRYWVGVAICAGLLASSGIVMAQEKKPEAKPAAPAKPAARPAAAAPKAAAPAGRAGSAAAPAGRSGATPAAGRGPAGAAG